MNDAHFGLTKRIFAGALSICVSCTPARSLETNDAVWAAAIEYLQSHIAMEILSRSECGKSTTLTQFGSSGFGTGIFLEEMSKYFTVEEIERLDRWLLSNEYRALLLTTTRGVYNLIGVGSTDRSRCASALERYGPSLSQSKANFLDLLPAKMECAGSAGSCGPGNGVDFEENSNAESYIDEKATSGDPQISHPRRSDVENSNIESDMENSNIESSGTYEENSN